MNYPASIPLRQLTFGPAFVMENGDLVAMRVTIKASRSLVWRETGSPLISVSKSFSGAAGVEASFMLPATDQEGWSDGAGSIIDVSAGQQTHLYTATIAYTADGSSLGTVTVGPFALPLGDSTPVDIDDMLPITASPGISILIPDSWSDQVDAAEAAALAAQAAAEAAVAGAVAPGGLTGQVLAKASDTDGDVEWVDQTGGGGGAPAYATALAGSTFRIYYDTVGAAWPARPSARADLHWDWVDIAGTHGDPPGAISGSDFVLRPPP